LFHVEQFEVNLRIKNQSFKKIKTITCFTLLVICFLVELSYKLGGLVTDEKLQQYVKDQFAQGKNKDDIRKELLNVGWSDKVIAGAMPASELLSTNDYNCIPLPNKEDYFDDFGIKKSLDQKAVWAFMINFFGTYTSFIVWFGGLLIFTIVQDNLGNLGFISYSAGLVSFILFVILFLILLGSYFWAYLSYINYKYELTEEGITKEYGVIYKKNVTIPYERIQNININRGIVARLLGLSDLHIFTAGTASFGGINLSAEGRLPGLAQKDAEDLRKVLLHMSKNNKGI
jgi:membrane protein YdbS with pleckstrin-like domain